MRKPFRETNGADQLCRSHAADQPFCYIHMSYTYIPLLPKSKISIVQPSSLAVQPVFCWTLSETSKIGFRDEAHLFCLTLSKLWAVSPVPPPNKYNFLS